jgi:hypothetical protein
MQGQMWAMGMQLEAIDLQVLSTMSITLLSLVSRVSRITTTYIHMSR